MIVLSARGKSASRYSSSWRRCRTCPLGTQSDPEHSNFLPYINTTKSSRTLIIATTVFVTTIVVITILPYKLQTSAKVAVEERLPGVDFVGHLCARCLIGLGLLGLAPSRGTAGFAALGSWGFLSCS